MVIDCVSCGGRGVKSKVGNKLCIHLVGSIRVKSRLRWYQTVSCRRHRSEIKLKLVTDCILWRHSEVSKCIAFYILDCYSALRDLKVLLWDINSLQEYEHGQM